MQFRSLRLALAVAAMAAIGSGASAIPHTFGSFSFVGPALVNYDQATGVLSGTAIPIRFNYVNGGGSIIGTPAPGFTQHNATLTFTATRLSNATSFSSIGAQELQLGSFDIALDTPIAGKTNLLSGSSSGGVLQGTLGGSVAGYSGSMGAGDNISYASDFLSFPPPTDADFAWAFQSVGPPLAISGSNFQSFTATVAGSFGYDTAPTANVPEGGSLALMGAGLIPLVAIIRRKRR